MYRPRFLKNHTNTLLIAFLFWVSCTLSSSQRSPPPSHSSLSVHFHVFVACPRLRSCSFTYFLHLFLSLFLLPLSLLSFFLYYPLIAPSRQPPLPRGECVLGERGVRALPQRVCGRGAHPPHPPPLHRPQGLPRGQDTLRRHPRGGHRAGVRARAGRHTRGEGTCARHNRDRGDDRPCSGGR